MEKAMISARTKMMSESRRKERPCRSESPSLSEIREQSFIKTQIATQQAREGLKAAVSYPYENLCSFKQSSEPFAFW